MTCYKETKSFNAWTQKLTIDSLLCEFCKHSEGILIAGVVSHYRFHTPVHDDHRNLRGVHSKTLFGNMGTLLRNVLDNALSYTLHN